jgi:hypothetical protein
MTLIDIQAPSSHAHTGTRSLHPSAWRPRGLRASTRARTALLACARHRPVRALTASARSYEARCSAHSCSRRPDGCSVPASTAAAAAGRTRRRCRPCRTRPCVTAHSRYVTPPCPFPRAHMCRCPDRAGRHRAARSVRRRRAGAPTPQGEVPRRCPSSKGTAPRTRPRSRALRVPPPPPPPLRAPCHGRASPAQARSCTTAAPPRRPASRCCRRRRTPRSRTPTPATARWACPRTGRSCSRT